MARFTLETYNCFYRVGENGFENLNEQKLIRYESDIIIERKTSLFENKVIINRKDGHQIKSETLFSFFDDTNPKVPDRQNSDFNSKMSLNIIGISKTENFKMTYVLKQNFEQHYSNYKKRFKFNNIRLLINNNEAYLIYPNGMGRIYKNE